MTHLSKNTKKCHLCGHTNLIKYLDLGKTALVNSYIKTRNKKENKYPLQVLYCGNCHLSQLNCVVNRKLIFQKYAYFSSTSPQLEKYFKEYAEKILKKFPHQSRKLIVEIASNDGILLKYFKKEGVKVLGIDPAKNIAKIANKKGLKTLPLFFNQENSKIIRKKYGKAGVIIANNVLAHDDNINSILKGVTNLLDKDGVFVFEVQYLLDLIERKAFDNTYHEHVFYFSVHPLKKALEEHGLQIFNIEKTPAQGGSIRVYVGHMNTYKVNKNVDKLLKSEKSKGLYKIKTYKEFSKKPEELKIKLIKLLKNVKKDGGKIAGYGASAKGNTLLQYCGIDTKLIDYIVDTAPSKQGKFTPGTYIPIHPISQLKKDTPDYVLILAWNYADSIIKKEKWLKKKGVKFIIPISKVKVV